MKGLVWSTTALLILVTPVMAGDDNAKSAASTLDNLMAAYNGESNAHAKYLAYAKKADEEGYAPIGSLFRAAARAEEIHAANHAKVIKALGGKPQAEINLPEICSTAENLREAIKGESYERDEMYPSFLNTARRERNRDAMRSFNFARTAEAEHAQLYQNAVDNLEAYKSNQKATFMVCTTCGYTVLKKDFTFSKCPSCFDPADKYEAVE